MRFALYFCLKNHGIGALGGGLIPVPEGGGIMLGGGGLIPGMFWGIDPKITIGYPVGAGPRAIGIGGLIGIILGAIPIWGTTYMALPIG